MSFTTDVISEIILSEKSKTCCKKAFLYGLFFGATVDDQRNVCARFKTEESALAACRILERQFSTEVRPVAVIRAGRPEFSVCVRTRALLSFLQAQALPTADAGAERELSDLVGFRCAECSAAFLGGVFVSVGTASDPNKGYHMEFALSDPLRAEKLCRLLGSEIAVPRTVRRDKKTGVYYKSNSAIADVLYYIGAPKASFAVANACIGRDIRNVEKRATNCILRNLSRSTEASRKQIEQIERLIASGKLLKLPEELRYTAMLRLENPASSLSELALIHEPPISKSGLNRRLTRIIEEAEALDNK